MMCGAAEQKTPEPKVGSDIEALVDDFRLPNFTELSQLSAACANKSLVLDARLEKCVYSTGESSCLLVLRAGISTATGILTSDTAACGSASSPDNNRLEMFQLAINTPPGSLVRVAGVLEHQDWNGMPTEGAAGSKIQLSFQRFQVLSRVSPHKHNASVNCPTSPHKAGQNNVQTITNNFSVSAHLTSRVLHVRRTAQFAIFQLNSHITNLFVDYFNAHGFTCIHTPKLISARLSGDEGFFPVDYCGRKAYLAQSPQYYKQMAIAMDMKRVYEIGPIFRAEEKDDHRHLTEFTGIDFEMAFRLSYLEVLSFAETLLVSIIRTLQTDPKYRPLIAAVRQEYPSAGILRLPFPGEDVLRVSFSEARAMLKQAGLAERADMSDLSMTEELALGTLVSRKHQTDIFTLTHLPRHFRPFYSYPSDTDPECFTNSYDLMLRGQEVLSGSQRIHEYDDLAASIAFQNDLRRQHHQISKDSSGDDDQDKVETDLMDINSECLRYYVDSFRHGYAPHAGGGFGLNRVLQFWLGLPDIRDATLFVRDLNTLVP